ncbi:OmpA family protein, partial [Zhongshania sp.]
TLTAKARKALDAQIVRLKKTTGPVRLEGHADERGTREYNIALGERRANAVADYMAINGIPRYRIETVSYGEERPVAFGQSEATYSQNRRVELK